MNYIVFDLEWNQSPSGHYRENAKIPFEILEIGAVKLNSHCKKIGEFHETIKPLVYRSMNKRTQDVIHIDFAALQKSRTFSPVARSFLQWIGDEEYMFVTWGPSDIFELERNMDYYRIPYDFPRPLFYYDLQKLYSLTYLDGKKRPALNEAVSALHLPEEMDYHSAYADACYTAEVMRQMNLKPVLEYKSVDYYHLPADKDEEIFLHFSTYDKYVSMPYSSKEEALDNKTVSALKCTRCNLPMFNHVRWFAGSSGNLYYSLAQCPRHGYVKGKIRIRKAPGGQIYIVKTVKPATETDVADIRAKKESVKEKRHKRIEREKMRRRRKKEQELGITAAEEGMSLTVRNAADAAAAEEQAAEAPLRAAAAAKKQAAVQAQPDICPAAGTEPETAPAKRRNFFWRKKARP